ADRMVPVGAIMHYTVTAGGAGYTSAPTATLSGGGCTSYPTLQTMISGGAVPVVWAANGNIGAGCTSPPTVTITGGGGAGAAATATLASNGQTDASVPPEFFFHSAPDQY